MFQISKSTIVKSYNTVKKEVFKSYSSNNIDRLIKFVDISAIVAASFNWMYFDNEIEDLLKKLADENLDKSNERYISNPKRIVFYDQIGSTICLGLQYLRGLILGDYEILYIFESSDRKCSPLVLQELGKFPNAKCLIIDSNEPNKINKIKELREIILSFQPEKAIIHGPAGGAFGVILWNGLTEIKRYRIVPGDHHYYIGTSCSDFYFEFRRYGYTIAVQKRDIPVKQILFQPYYPIVDDRSFSGFPIDTKDKIVIFSAGALYKAYGDNDLFFKLIKKLLLGYPQVVIFFAGVGFDMPFKKFIKKNDFQNRFYLLGYRNDISMCMANSDIHLVTYPFMGALISQYAAYHSKPILSYTKKEYSGNNSLEDIIGSPLDIKSRITFTDIDEFFDYAGKLINNRIFRVNEGERMNDCLTKEDDFNTRLISNLKGNILLSKIDELTIDYDKQFEYYLNIENFYIPNIKLYLFRELKFKYFYLFPELILPAFTNRFFLKKIIDYIIGK